MPEKSAHPSQKQLSAYNLGQLTPDESVAVESHISECDRCCETIVNLSSDDTFIGLLKKAKQLPTAKTLDHVSNSNESSSAMAANDVPPSLANHPRYEIVRLIGQGGMGVVYEAIHRKMERTVALKVLNRELVERPEAVARFQREVKAAAQLSHPNIVTSHDADQADDHHFMVMEYVDGVDLSQIVQNKGALSIADACGYIRQAAIGLQHAHERGMVHRDIKPHNLMVTQDGTLKILDFGLASLAPAQFQDEDSGETHGGLTLAGAIMGTPDFISPEQAQDAREVDGRSDIYSLGMTLYYLLAGSVPFSEGSAMAKIKMHAESDPADLATIREDLPDALIQIVSKMIAKNPSDRFQTPLDIAEALQPFIESSSDAKTEKIKKEPKHQGVPPRHWNRSWLFAGGAFSVATLLICFFYFAQETVADKLARLKTPEEAELPAHLASKNEVRAGWYNVEGDALGGRAAAICDIGNFRIALLGQDISENRDSIVSHYLRISGPLDKKQGIYADEEMERDNKPYFWNEYSNGVADCRFHDFRFTLTDRVIRYGKFQHVWNDPDSPGLLIMVDTDSGLITTQVMKPQSKRGTVPGLMVLGPKQNEKKDADRSHSIDGGSFDGVLKAALSEAAGIPNDQWDQIAANPVGATAGIQGEPLSMILLNLRPEKVSKNNPEVLKDFRWVDGAPEQGAIRKAMQRIYWKGFVSLLQSNYLRELKYGEIKNGDKSTLLTGSVRFYAKNVCDGRVEFVAEPRGNDLPKIIEFRLPNYGLKVLRQADGSWRSEDLQTVDNAYKRPLGYDLSQVPANAREIYGFRPKAIHTDGRFVNLWDVLRRSPLAYAIDEKLAEVLLVKLPFDNGTLMPPVSVLTVADGNASAFAFGSLSQTTDIPKEISPWTYYPAKQPEQFFRIVDNRTIVMGTRQALDKHTESLKSSPNTDLSMVARSLPDGPLFVIGNSRDKRFLEMIKEQGIQNALGTVTMSHIPLWQDTSYLLLSLSLGRNPQLHFSAHSSSSGRQKRVTQTMQILPVSLANLIRSMTTIGESPLDVGCRDAIVTALSEAEITQLTETDTRLTVSLKKAEPQLFKLLNSYFNLNKAKTRAYKAASSNNLRQIGMAMMLFENDHGYLPSVTTKLPGAKHPVSWRVAILKYLDERLFNQYNLDEPWDSEHNKKLLKELPIFYRHPGQQKGIPNTCYVTLVGNSTATGDGISVVGMLKDIKDSPTQTILVTEGYTDIPWTKPEDHVFKNEATLPVRRPHRDGWNVIFVDGSTHFISSETPNDVLKALITRNGGELIQSINGSWKMDGVNENKAIPSKPVEQDERNKQNASEKTAIAWVRSVDGMIRRAKKRGKLPKKGHIESVGLRRGAGSKPNAIRVDDEGLKHLVAFPQLQKLDLGASPQVTSNGVKGLARLPKLFDLSYTPGKKDCIQALSQLTNLRRLNLFQAKTVTDSDLMHLSGLPLEKLCLSYTSVSDDGLKHVVPMSGLDTLHLEQTSVSDAGVKQLADMESLRSLNLSQTKITKSGLEELTRLKKLQVLSLAGLKFGDTDIEPLLAFSGLEKLSLYNNPVTDEGLKTIGRLKELRRLSLVSTQVTDEGLKLLAGCSKLEMVDLYDTKVTQNGTAALRKALPNCVIVRSFSYGGIPDLKITRTENGVILEAPEDGWP